MLGVRFTDLGWPLVSPLISHLTGHWANHVDLLTGGNMMVSALPGGVTERPITSLLGRRVELVDVPCDPFQAEAAIAFARAQLGKPYDYGGVISFRFGAGWAEARRWFCSELTAAALVHAGIIQAPRARRISPGDLHRMLTAEKGRKASGPRLKQQGP